MASRKGSTLDALVQMTQFDLVQAAADGVAVVEVDTGISTAATFGWLIDRIEFHLADTLEGIPLATDQQIRLQLARGPSTGVFLPVSNDDMICDFLVMLPTIAGSVGNPVLTSPLVWVPPDNYVIASPTVTARLDTAGTGLTETYGCRIFWFPIEMSELDLLRILAQ